jgi:hypothetical protein
VRRSAVAQTRDPGELLVLAAARWRRRAGATQRGDAATIE